MERKKHKHAFEIQAWSNGWEVLYYDSEYQIWDIDLSPIWHTDLVFVVNDALVEFRKAEKEGKQVQKLIIPNWVNISMDKVPPMSGGCIAGFRIKPSEPEIDWSILNDTDWFYVKGQYKWVLCGCYMLRGYIRAIHVFSITQNISKGPQVIIDKSDIKELRLATPEEKQMVFDKYPELKPVEVGDFGVFWDDVLDGVITIGHLDKIMVHSTNGCKYKSKYNDFWKNFRRINHDKLREQVPELFDEGKSDN